MRIKTNISALNAHGKLSKNQSSVAKNLEKLSSGYKINRAGDDAAGLSISEKMRALITGMEQAELNTEDGIGLIRTGEGALQEVHAMLNRLDELAVQSANGIYNDESDRASLQKEVDKIREEIDRIARTTNFNGINLFQDEGLEAEADVYSALMEEEISSMKSVKEPSTLEDVLADSSDTLKNIIYTETTFDFEATQSPAGTENTSFNAQYQNIADVLQGSIVPQVVSAIMGRYTAFNYLTGSSIGIGLDLYEDPSSSTLASVSVSTSYTQSGGTNSTDFLTYSLRVNVAKVGDLTQAADRSSLEQTIAHEMIHAFMDEATTTGMTGIAPSGASNAQFPGWFVEGMAQTASGPGNWTRGVSLNLKENSTPAQITAALSGNNALGTRDPNSSEETSSSQYGTGYLACMYLGYQASGGTADMSNPTAAADAITQGISNILSKLIEGKSLETVIKETTGGKYPTISSFQSGFSSDTSALDFIQKLLKYTSDSPDNSGNVGGGLLSGSLSATDPVADADISGLKLFALNTANTQVKNTYPAEITVLSGGGAAVDGVKPVNSSKPVVYPSNVFTVTGGTEGVDWRFDTNTGTLHILTDQVLDISGGTLTNADGTFYGNIVINSVPARVILGGVNIDASKKGGNIPGILIADSHRFDQRDVDIFIYGNNTIIGGGESAGIQLIGNNIYGKDSATQAAEHNAIMGTSVNIEVRSSGGVPGVLNVTGGTSGNRGGAGIGAAWGTDTSKSDIKISGTGTINAKGGIGGAGIGGSEGGSIGNITIEGRNGKTLNINALGGDHGAGIGGGGWVSTFTDPELQRVEMIEIGIDVNINASSNSHGTGIGSGCHGAVGTIMIGKRDVDNSNIQIETKGGNDGAAIGAGWAGTMDEIIIHGGNINAEAGKRGAGIGSGYEAEGGGIVINGGTITSTGSTNSSGIGGGMNGTVSSIKIKGGTITADGGWTNDGGNIGGYTDKSNTQKTTVTISDPSGLTIKAGEKGEGKYITTGTVDANGKTLYALDMKYIDQLLHDGKFALDDFGADPRSLSYPLQTVNVVLPDGTSYSWNNLRHMSENSAYIWARGEDITLSFTDADGTKGTVALKFFPDYGLWRMSAADLPPELPKEPGYVGGDTSRPDVPVPLGSGAIILQVGPNPGNIFVVPRFYFSRAALQLDGFDISTQPNARSSIDKVDKMIDRVSEIRSTYGAMDNALGHIINNLNVGIENLSQAESRIRDADMAKEMMNYTKNNILVQSAQFMLAHANMRPQAVLELLR